MSTTQREPTKTDTQYQLQAYIHAKQEELKVAEAEAVKAKGIADKANDAYRAANSKASFIQMDLEKAVDSFDVLMGKKHVEGRMIEVPKPEDKPTLLEDTYGAIRL